nr:phage BR0599 family protein [Bradyrhizobium sp. 150]
MHYAITIFQPSETIRLTTDFEDATLGGRLFEAAGAVNITNIVYAADGFATSADVQISSTVGGSIRPGLAARGLLDGLPITVEAFDPRHPESGTFDMVPGATIGSVAESTNGAIVLAVQGRLALMKSPMCQVYSSMCRARLGDSRCRVPISVDLVARGQAYVLKDNMKLQANGKWGASQAWVKKLEGGSYNDIVYECTTAGTSHATVAPTYPTVIGSTVTDGTAVFTARQAWLVAATGQALDFFNIQLDADPSVTPSILGNIIPQTGELTNTRIPIKAYDEGTRIVTLWQPFAPSNFPAATEFLIHPGCDRTMATCRDVFDNIKNMRAEPYAPNSDLVTGRA